MEIEARNLDKKVMNIQNVIYTYSTFKIYSIYTPSFSPVGKDPEQFMSFSAPLYEVYNDKNAKEII